MNTKQIIILRKDLKMRRGKECSQAAHLSMKFIVERMRIMKGLKVVDPFDMFTLAEQHWFNNSFVKITCSVDSLEELMDIHKKAQEAKLEVHIIEDNGATEFHNVKTVTGICIGPDYSDKIDPITKDLRLY